MSENETGIPENDNRIIWDSKGMHMKEHGFPFSVAALVGLCLAAFGCDSRAGFDRTLLDRAELPARGELHEHHGSLLGWIDFRSCTNVDTRMLGEHEVTIVTHPVHWVDGGQMFESQHKATPTRRLTLSGPHIISDTGPVTLWHGQTLLGRLPWLGQWALMGEHPRKAVMMTIGDHAGAGGPVELSAWETSVREDPRKRVFRASGFIWLDSECKNRRYTCSLLYDVATGLPSALRFDEIDAGPNAGTDMLILR